MFLIGEFSKLTQVSARMLRHYDENGLLSPAKIDRFTGYRFYSTSQIPKLQRILLLRDMGFGVAEIKKILINWEDETIISALKNKQLQLGKEAQQLKNRVKKIDVAINDIQKKQVEIHANFILKEVPSYPVFSLRKIIPSYFDEGALWKEMAKFSKENGIPINERTEVLSIYHDAEYKNKNVDVEICAICEKIETPLPDGFAFRQTEQIPHMACAMVYGPFENINKAFLDFAGWLDKNPQYKMRETSRQICHRGPWNEEKPENYLTEIQVPVEIKNK